MVIGEQSGRERGRSRRRDGGFQAEKVVGEIEESYRRREEGGGGGGGGGMYGKVRTSGE